MSGAITFKIYFEPGTLPETWPEPRQRKTRTKKDEIAAQAGEDAAQDAPEMAQEAADPQLEEFPQDEVEAANEPAEAGRGSSRRSNRACRCRIADPAADERRRVQHKAQYLQTDGDLRHRVLFDGDKDKVQDHCRKVKQHDDREQYIFHG